MPTALAHREIDVVLYNALLS